MAETPSTLTLGRGERAPNFTLPDGTGRVWSLGEARGERGTVVAFVCNHCPYVVLLAEAIGRMAAEYATQGIGFVAISSNDVENYPQDSPEAMVAFAENSGWDFPYLYDESQEVAKAYFAACTPDFYVFDGELNLAYAGQFDGARPKGDVAVKGDDLRAALEAVLAGREAATGVPSTGCNIKWRPGQEPAYFG